jgi:hypothetical protein
VRDTKTAGRITVYETPAQDEARSAATYFIDLRPQPGQAWSR